MEEKTKSPVVVGTPPPGGGIFDEEGGGGGIATVASGVYSEQIDVADQSVGEVRRRFADRFDIDPQSQAVLDGQPVGDDIVIRAGQILMFTHRAGEKGRIGGSPRFAVCPKALTPVN